MAAVWAVAPLLGCNLSEAQQAKLASSVVKIGGAVCEEFRDEGDTVDFVCKIVESVGGVVGEHGTEGHPSVTPPRESEPFHVKVPKEAVEQFKREHPAPMGVPKS